MIGPHGARHRDRGRRLHGRRSQMSAPGIDNLMCHVPSWCHVLRRHDVVLNAIARRLHVLLVDAEFSPAIDVVHDRRVVRPARYLLFHVRPNTSIREADHPIDSRRDDEVPELQHIARHDLLQSDQMSPYIVVIPPRSRRRPGPCRAKRPVDQVPALSPTHLLTEFPVRSGHDLTIDVVAHQFPLSHYPLSSRPDRHLEAAAPPCPRSSRSLRWKTRKRITSRLAPICDTNKSKNDPDSRARRSRLLRRPSPAAEGTPR